MREAAGVKTLQAPQHASANRLPSTLVHVLIFICTWTSMFTVYVRIVYLFVFLVKSEYLYGQF